MANYSFDRLSIQDQSDLIREFIKAGIYDLNQMKDHYEKSEFKKNGGHMFVDGGEFDNWTDDDIARILTQQRGWGFTGLSEAQKKQEIANYRSGNHVDMFNVQQKANQASPNMYSIALGQQAIQQVKAREQAMSNDVLHQQHVPKNSFDVRGDLQYNKPVDKKAPYTLTSDKIRSRIIEEELMKERAATIGQSNKTAEEIAAIDDRNHRDWSFGNIPVGKYMSNLDNTVQDFDETFNMLTPLREWTNPFNLLGPYWTLKGGVKLLNQDPSGALDVVLGNLHYLPPMYRNAKNMYQASAREAMNLGIMPNSVRQAADAYQNIADRFHKKVKVFEDKTGFTPKEFLKNAITYRGFTKAGDNINAALNVYFPTLDIEGGLSANRFVSQYSSSSNSIGKHVFITPDGNSIPRYYTNLSNLPSFYIDKQAIHSSNIQPRIKYSQKINQNAILDYSTPLDKLYIRNTNPTRSTSSNGVMIPKNSPEYYTYMKKRVNDLQEFADGYNGALAGSTKLYRENWQIPNDVEFEMTKANADKFVKDYGHVNRNLIGVDGYNITLGRDILAKDGSVLVKKGSTIDVPFIDSKNPKFVRETNLDVAPQKATKEYTERAFRGESGDVPYYTSDEVVQHIKDSNVKQAKDTLKSKNPKHVNRAVGMLFSDDPKIMKTTSKALDEMKKEIPNYVDYYTEGMFNDVNSNKEFLKKIIEKIPESEADRIAANPEHMKLIADKWYYENTVTTGRFDATRGWSIEESAKANSAVTSASGGGRNTTTSSHGGGTGYGNYERVSQIPFSYTRDYKNAMDLYSDFIRTNSTNYDTLVESTIEQHLQDLGISLPMVKNHNLSKGRWSNAIAEEMLNAGYTKEQVRNTVRELSKRFDSPGYFSNEFYNEGKYVGDFGSNLENENMFVFKDEGGLGFEKTNHLDKRTNIFDDSFVHTNFDDFIFSPSDKNALGEIPVTYKSKPFRIDKRLVINTDTEMYDEAVRQAVAKGDPSAIADPKGFKRSLELEGHPEIRKQLDELEYSPYQIEEQKFNTAKDHKKYETSKKLGITQEVLQKGLPAIGGISLASFGLYNAMSSEKNSAEDLKKHIEERKVDLTKAIEKGDSARVEQLKKDIENMEYNYKIQYTSEGVLQYIKKSEKTLNRLLKEGGSEEEIKSEKYKINLLRKRYEKLKSNEGFLTHPFELGGGLSINKIKDPKELFKRKFGWIMSNREIEKLKINDALRREKADRLNVQYELARRRSGAIKPIEGINDPTFLVFTIPAIIPKLGFSTLLGAGTRVIGNSFNNTKMGNVLNTGLNVLSPFLGPFGKGISIADSYYDGKQFLQNPSLYNGINFGMNYFNYNPFTTSNIDEKIASGWELFDGVINNK